MKIFFVGSLISDESLDQIDKNSKIKPSGAPVYFERMMMKGLKETGNELCIRSIPPVNTMPGGCTYGWGKRTESVSDKLKVCWIPAINIQGIKQMCIRANVKRELKKWLVENKDEKDKVIMTYSIYPPYTKPVIDMGKKYNCKTLAVITDLPEYMYKMSKHKGLKGLFANRFSELMKYYQDKYDSYILLTKHMLKRCGLEKFPYIVLEGFADEENFKGIDGKKAEKKTVMYAGALSKSFNVDKLLDGFMKISGDYNLWLFGYGDLVDYIKECEKKDSRIKYFGKVDRKTLLEHQKMAHLLVSVKSAKEDHANYAFPSKILEYMTSGTAVASTVVGGIPEEYFEYIYPIYGNDSESIRNSIESILALSENELAEKGALAKNFAIANKNYIVQGKRISEFLNRVVREENDL